MKLSWDEHLCSEVIKAKDTCVILNTPCLAHAWEKACTEASQFLSISGLPEGQCDLRGELRKRPWRILKEHGRNNQPAKKESIPYSWRVCEESKKYSERVSLHMQNSKITTPAHNNVNQTRIFLFSSHPFTPDHPQQRVGITFFTRYSFCPVSPRFPIVGPNWGDSFDYWVRIHLLIEIYLETQGNNKNCVIYKWQMYNKKLNYKYYIKSLP